MGEKKIPVNFTSANNWHKVMTDYQGMTEEVDGTHFNPKRTGGALDV